MITNIILMSDGASMLQIDDSIPGLGDATLTLQDSPMEVRV